MISTSATDGRLMGGKHNKLFNQFYMHGILHNVDSKTQRELSIFMIRFNEAWTAI
jgi:hypothetical protein